MEDPDTSITFAGIHGTRTDGARGATAGDGDEFQHPGISDEFSDPSDATIELCQAQVARIVLYSGLLCIPIGWFSVTTARKTLEGLYALYGGTARKALHQLVLSSEDNPYSPNFASTPRRPLAYPTRQTSWSAIFTLALWYSSLCCFAGTFLAGLFIFNKFRPWMHSKTASTSPPSTSLRAQVTQETLHNESRRHRHDLLDWRVFAKTELLKLFFQIGLGLLLTGTCEFVRSLWPVPGKLSTILFTVFQATFIWHLVLTWSSLLETLSSTFSSQPIPPQPQNSYHPPDRPNGSPQQSEVLIFDDGYIESSLQREFADSEGGAVINCIKRILSYRLHQPIQSLHDSFLAKLQHISIQARLTLIQVIVDALNREADSWYQPGPSSSTFSVQQAQHGNSLDNKRDGTHDSSDEDEEKWKPWMNEAIAGLDTMVESLQQHSSQSPSTQSTEANVGRLLVRLLDHGEVVARGLIVALSTSPRFSLRLWLPLISKSEVAISFIVSAQQLALTGLVPPTDISRIVEPIVSRIQEDILLKYQKELDDLWVAIRVEREVTMDQDGF